MEQSFAATSDYIAEIGEKFTTSEQLYEHLMMNFGNPNTVGKKIIFRAPNDEVTFSFVGSHD
jgi:hypothetical protein